METTNKKINIETLVNAPVEKVWNYFTTPEHIIQWNYASDNWFTPMAKNDLRIGGKFTYRMEAKDGSFGFDFGGIYDAVEVNKNIEYKLGDDRKVQITFLQDGDKTKVAETFDPENSNPVEMQQQGWQVILDNFKKYVEST